MYEGIPAKWQRGLAECLVRPEETARIPGEVERFLERLVTVIGGTDWKHYRDALGDLEIPRGYSNVRVRREGSQDFEVQIFAWPGKRIDPWTVAIAASASGRRDVVSIRQIAPVEGPTGSLDLAVTCIEDAL